MTINSRIPFGVYSMYKGNDRFSKIAAVFLLALSAQFALAAGNSKPQIVYCQGQYALCAGSTGTLTGKNISVKTISGVTQIFPAATVVCPVVTGMAVAGLNAGTMGNSCTAPSGLVYSLFAQPATYPQATQNFQTEAPVETTCTGASIPNITINTPTFKSGLTQAISQCWSMACTINATPVNGVTTANCVCPVGEAILGGLIPQNMPSVTQAQVSSNGKSPCGLNPVALSLGGVQ
jgi:hypothetical protein